MYRSLLVLSIKKTPKFSSMKKTLHPFASPIHEAIASLRKGGSHKGTMKGNHHIPKPNQIRFNT